MQDKPTDEIILNWLSKYNKPSLFLSHLKKQSIKFKDKGLFFFNTAITLYENYEYSLAVAVWENTLGYFHESGAIENERTCYNNIGLAYSNLGNFRKAIKYFNQSLKISRKIGDNLSESDCLANVGVTYDTLGDSKNAIGYYQRAIEIKNSIGDKFGEAKCYLNLGAAYFCLGEEESDTCGKKSLYHEAISNYKKSLEITKNCENINDDEKKLTESDCYLNLGIVYYFLGDLEESIKNKKPFCEEAIDYCKKALEVKKEFFDKSGQAACYTNLGNIYQILGNVSKVIKYHKISLKLVKETNQLEYQRIVNLNLGKSYQEKDPKKAYYFFKQSIEISEIINSDLILDDYTRHFQEQASTAYQLMVPLCIKLEKKEKALEYLEGSKSRAIIDLLATTRIQPNKKITNDLADLFKTEANCLQNLQKIQTQNIEQEEIEVILEDLEKVYKKMEKTFPEYVSLRKVRVPSFSKILDIISSQNRPTTLIEYFVTKNEIIIFVIKSTERKVHVRSVPIKEDKLVKIIQDYEQQRKKEFKTNGKKSVLTELSDVLIDPISNFLADENLVYFVPYGFIHHLPLHALHLFDDPLIKRHAVAYLPSTSVLRFLQHKGSGKIDSCVSFGVPSVSDTRNEKIVIYETSKRIAKLFHTKPILNYNVTKENVLKEILNKDVIHFSCHGFFNTRKPLLSNLQLFNGITMTAKEIFQMQINPEIVTLGSCKTGFNKITLGDELLGIPRAFLYAGAPSIIASLWGNYSQPTFMLLYEFYDLLKKGLDKATALQKAQIFTMKQYPDVYHWAPLTLIGRYW